MNLFRKTTQSVSDDSFLDTPIGRAIARQLQRALRLPKILLAISLVGLLIALISIGLVVNRIVTHPTANKIVQNNINACQDGNVNRLEQIEIWDKFIGLIVGKNPSPAIAAEAKSFEGFISMVNAPRDCQKIYNVTAVEVTK